MLHPSPLLSILSILSLATQSRQALQGTHSSLGNLELLEQLAYEVGRVLLQLLGLQLVVVVLVDLPEHRIDKFVSQRQVHVILREEHGQEVTQLLAVQSPVFVLVELRKVQANLLVKLTGLRVERL